MKGRPIGIKNTVFHIWTEEEKEYLREITPGHHYKEIQALMAKRFNIDFTMQQIKGAIARCSLKTGFSGCFNEKHIPFNKGKNIQDYMCEESLEEVKRTQFKKGIIPPNWKPTGSERTTIDGYTEIKVAEPNKWRLKQQLIYENNKGEIPPGYVVIFADKDKNNFEIDNLILISRRKLLVMNKNKLIKSDSELTKTGTIIAEVLIKISERKNNC